MALAFKGAIPYDHLLQSSNLLNAAMRVLTRRKEALDEQRADASFQAAALSRMNHG